VFVVVGFGVRRDVRFVVWNRELEGRSKSRRRRRRRRTRPSFLSLRMRRKGTRTSLLGRGRVETKRRVSFLVRPSLQIRDLGAEETTLELGSDS